MSEFIVESSSSSMHIERISFHTMTMSIVVSKNALDIYIDTFEKLGINGKFVYLSKPKSNFVDNPTSGCISEDLYYLVKKKRIYINVS